MADTDLSTPMWMLTFAPVAIAMTVAILAWAISACSDPFKTTRNKRG